MGDDAKEWQHKNERIKKAKFLRELEQIKLQKNTVERERIGFMYEKRDKQYSYLEEMEKSLNEELKCESLKIEQQLKKIGGKVTDFQHELKRVKPTPEFVEKLKVMMEAIETTIGDFKQKQRVVFENLMISERETEQEISVLEGKINALKEGGEITSRQIKSAKIIVKSQNSNIPKEIRQFETFVAQTGGFQGGWDDYDHGTFLRIRDKYKGNKSFIAAAARQIPGRSEGDMAEHEKWYSHFLELKRRKKEVIQMWRKEKENCKDHTNVEEDVEATKVKKEKEAALQKRLQEESQAKKEELQKWKARKHQRLQEEEEKKVLEEKRKQVIEEKKRKERDTARKAAQQILKERREEEERLRWMQEIEVEQMEIERQEEIRDRIAQFQSRDRVALEIKQSEQKKKQEAESIRKDRLEKAKLKVEVKRDPNRLYQLTEGWVHRSRDTSDGSASGGTLPAKMPHRAIPAWRQNL